MWQSNGLCPFWNLSTQETEIGSPWGRRLKKQAVSGRVEFKWETPPQYTRWRTSRKTNINLGPLTHTYIHTHIHLHIHMQILAHSCNTPTQMQTHTHMHTCYTCDKIKRQYSLAFINTYLAVLFILHVILQLYRVSRHCPTVQTKSLGLLGFTQS